MKRLLITGAAGGLGKVSRKGLRGLADAVRLSDVMPIADAEAGMEVVTCDLADEAAVMAMVEGCDGILHLGGVATEQPFPAILRGNLIGVHNLYEAARVHGVGRIFLASSNHVIGYYEQTEHLSGNAPHKPDGWYGISKSYAEAVALMYWHKFGIETAMVRIGSCFPEPVDHRMLASWLAPEDYLALVRRVFETPRLGCPVIWGMSDNDARWWDNSHVDYLGWKPKRNSAEFAEKIAATVPRPDKDAPAARWQGGNFTAEPVKKEK